MFNTTVSNGYETSFHTQYNDVKKYNVQYRLYYF